MGGGLRAMADGGGRGEGWIGIWEAGGEAGIGVDRHNYCSCKHTTEGDDPLINSYHAELYTQDITCMLNCFEEISQNFAFFLSLLCS